MEAKALRRALPGLLSLCGLLAFGGLAARPFDFGNLAGLSGSAGSTDGTGTAARFDTPYNVAVDPVGNAYVADYANHCIRKVTPYGVVTTLAGKAGASGWLDATGESARFSYPAGIAVGPGGVVYVADTGNQVIRKVFPDGQVLTFAGYPGAIGSANGFGSAARFAAPNGLAVHPSGDVYVADTYNHIIRHIGPGGFVETISGVAGVAGSTSGSSLGAALHNVPTSVALSANLTKLFITDYGSHTVRVHYLYDFNTQTLAGTAGASGAVDGKGAAARFNNPYAIAVDSGGNAYVTDQYNHTIRKVEADGTVTTIGGSATAAGSADGLGTEARFHFPTGIARSVDGALFVADQGTHRIVMGLKRAGAGEFSWGQFVGNPWNPGSQNGDRLGASFNSPQQMATDLSGNVYVPDRDNAVIRKITPVGTVTTLAGHAGSTGGVDGTGDAARFFTPTAVAFNGADALYVSDEGDHTVRRVSLTGQVTTLAGEHGVSGHSDGAGAAAHFWAPRGLTVSKDGQIVVADAGNHRIRRISPAGAVSTWVGSSAGYLDGVGTAAMFSAPVSICFDQAGNAYVADSANRMIRKITPAGLVTPLAGQPGVSGNSDGQGFLARFQQPSAVVFAPDGALWVADYGTLRSVTLGGLVSTLSTPPPSSLMFENGPGSEASFDSIDGFAVGPHGEVYVSSAASQQIRMGCRQGQWLSLREGNSADLFFGVDGYRAYRVERSQTLGAGDWTTVGNVGSWLNGAAFFTDPNRPAGKACYRLKAP